MTYATVMVNLVPGQTNAAVLQVAVDMSERLHASITGIAAGQLMTSMYADGYMSASLVNDDRSSVEHLLAGAETEFRHSLHNRAEGVQWRSMVTLGSPAAYVAGEARAADLIVIGAGIQGSRTVDPGDLIMQAGRPVLTVPPGTQSFSADCVVIAWKDTREARRATRDALPILKLADRVIVVEVTTGDDAEDAERRTHDVAGWLARHGVAAEAIGSFADGSNQHRLQEIARAHEAGLIVAGAYGHSRVREWIVGGVTRALLESTDCCSLLSH